MIDAERGSEPEETPMKRSALISLVYAAVACFALSFAPAAAQSSSASPAQDCVATLKEWIAKAADNICGLKDLNQLSNPAQVDFQALLAATPEMKELKDKHIDSSSPEGIRLTNAAADRVTKACEAVRASQGYCSVWKEIKHRDGRSVPDITDKVKAQF
jgi:hypothetical protein